MQSKIRNSVSMAKNKSLVPAATLARRSKKRFPNESSEYRKARTALLVEEIRLRRHIWRVGEMRRALPAGGKVRKDYRFVGKNGEASFEDLFEGKDTLVIYSMMYGPQRKQGCPMCTATLSSWAPEIPHLEQRLSLVVVARSPYKRIAKYAASRGWQHLPVYSDPSGDYTKDYVGKRDADYPAYHVFMRKDGVVRHFWGALGGKEIADPGQDPHQAPEFNPLWIILDTTPEGRGKDWYPKLDYRKPSGRR
jgi:predicted dithiol-disulfide oxidoreductase (DUF899 family)